MKFDPNLDSVQDVWGRCDFASNTITLFPDLPAQLIEATFWHEVMHAILTRLGYDELSHNEAFVDAISGGVHQVITTMKGNLEYNGKKKKAKKESTSGSGNSNIGRNVHVQKQTGTPDRGELKGSECRLRLRNGTDTLQRS